MEKQEKTNLTTVAGSGRKFRWLAVTTLLLAIGAILHLISPNVAGVTPNWMIAMYCIAINLVRPTIGQSAGIGLVAGALNIPTSKSAFPYGNFPSELAGAVICALIVHATVNMQIGKFNLKPAISALFSTIASGVVFCGILKVVLVLPMSVFLYAMMPVVLTVAVVNAVITQILYFPAAKLFAMNESK